ncbi:MAG: class I SAM-dependent methyltransferase [Steroidobacteraceae bacterium]
MRGTQNVDVGKSVRLAPTSAATVQRPSVIEALARRALFAKLKLLRGGRLVLMEGAARHVFGETSRNLPEEIVVTVQNPSFYADLVFGGSIGAGEAYMFGYWRTRQLVELVRLLVSNLDVLDNLEGGFARLTAPLQQALHAFRRNTRSGSRSNIAAHYDLGNEFFALFLDETMMYSAATFLEPQMSLHEAQLARLEGICRKLQLNADDHLLEIGTGWGGFALYAARRYGCRVTTTTISQEQCRLARERVQAAGLEDRIEVICSDYRDLTGRYDKLVSIEMVEAVGHHYFDTYFAKCSALLQPHGAMLLQAITIADQRYERARRSVDFIQRYIFPGSCLPSVAAMSASIARATDMRIFHLQDIGPHYARTLREWRNNLFANLAAVKTLGYGEEFIRMWEYYLCYCEGGFMERAVGDVQMLMVKPGNRREPL